MGIVGIEKSVRNRMCDLCGCNIEPRSEVFKIYQKSFHPRCLFKELVVVAGEVKYNKLLNEYIAEQV